MRDRFQQEIRRHTEFVVTTNYQEKPQWASKRLTSQRGRQNEVSKGSLNSPALENAVAVATVAARHAAATA